MNDLLLQAILKENVELRADVNAITDVYAKYLQDTAMFRRKEFNEHLLDPRRKEHIEKLIETHTGLTAQSKQELTDKYLTQKEN